jgi:hypothetical protein
LAKSRTSFLIAFEGSSCRYLLMSKICPTFSVCENQVHFCSQIFGTSYFSFCQPSAVRKKIPFCFCKTVF